VTHFQIIRQGRTSGGSDDALHILASALMRRTILLSGGGDRRR